MATSTHVAVALERPAGSVDRKPFPWTPAKRALAVTLALRLFYLGLGALFAPFLRLDPVLVRSNSLTENLMDRAAHPVLYALFGVWERFDTLWYIRIANHGYDSPIGTVFYPLYPALIRMLSSVTTYDLASALLISTLSSFFLFWGAFRLFELDYSPSVNNRAMILWLAWPASFTFFAGYPDSLLCALLVWSIYFARKRQWLAAGSLGLLAGLAKALGCMAALPLLWLAWKQRRWSGVLAALMCGAGTLCFQGWLAIHHFPSATVTYATFWNTATVAPWITMLDAVKSLARPVDLLLLLNICNVCVLLLTGYFALSATQRPEYRILAAAAIVLFLVKHTQPVLQSTTRYSLTLFMAYTGIGSRLRAPLPFAFMTMVAAMVNLLFFRLFLDWGLAV